MNVADLKRTGIPFYRESPVYPYGCPMGEELLQIGGELVAEIRKRKPYDAVDAEKMKIYVIYYIFAPVWAEGFNQYRDELLEKDLMGMSLEELLEECRKVDIVGII